MNTKFTVGGRSKLAARASNDQMEAVENCSAAAPKNSTQRFWFEVAEKKSKGSPCSLSYSEMKRTAHRLAPNCNQRRFTKVRNGKTGNLEGINQNCLCFQDQAGSAVVSVTSLLLPVSKCTAAQSCKCKKPRGFPALC